MSRADRRELACGSRWEWLARQARQSLRRRSARRAADRRAHGQREEPAGWDDLVRAAEEGNGDALGR